MKSVKKGKSESKNVIKNVQDLNKKKLASITGVLIAVIAVIIFSISAQHNKKQSNAATSSGLDTYRVLQLTASDNDFGGGKSDVTDSVVQDLGKHFSVVVNGGNVYSAQQISAMHAAHNDSDATNSSPVKMLVYNNGSHTNTGCADSVKTGAMAVDPNGNYLYSGNYTNNYLHDITNPAWYPYLVSTAQNSIRNSGYDGVWFDLLGDEPLRANYNEASNSKCVVLSEGADSNTVPANGRGVPYTPSQWAAGGTAELAYVRNALGTTTPIGFNGSRPICNSSDPQCYDTDGMFNGADFGMDENWMFSRNDPTYPSVNNWLADVNEVAHVASLGKQIQVYSKMFKDTADDSQTKQQTAVNNQDITHMFTLASFLLGTDGNQLFQFRLDDAPSSFTPKSKDYPSGVPWYQNLLIGHPTTPYTTVSCAAGSTTDCLYIRKFTQGYVIVNPSGSSKTVPASVLSGTFKNLDGNTVSYNSNSPLTLPFNTVYGSSSNPTVSARAQILLTTVRTTPTVTVSITSPTTSTVSGNNVTVTATASVPSPDSITGITLGLQESGTTLGTCTTSPCSVTWDTTTIPNGVYTLVADATSTNSGTGANSASVTVDNPPPGQCTTPPSTPTIQSKTLNTSTSTETYWNASTPGTGCTLKDYLVYRGGTYIASTTNTYYVDNGLKPNTTYTYTFQAEDTDGHQSAMSAPDTTTTSPPLASIVITSPNNGAMVKGNVNLKVYVTGGIAKINYVIDRVFYTQTTPSSPNAVWDSTTVNNGQHLIVVNGLNSSGSVVATSNITVNIKNVLCLKLVGGKYICF